MGYLDKKKPSKKRDSVKHVAMGRVEGDQKANPAAANMASMNKNMLGRRKGER